MTFHNFVTRKKCRPHLTPLSPSENNLRLSQSWIHTPSNSLRVYIFTEQQNLKTINTEYI